MKLIDFSKALYTFAIQLLFIKKDLYILTW